MCSLEIFTLASSSGSGKVPVRDPANTVMGRAPVPGWEATYDWNGWIPFDALPRENNPTSGAIGTANTMIVGPNYPYLLTLDWEESWRQQRVDQLIVDNQAPQTVAMSRDAQADVRSLAFATLGPKMIAMIEEMEGVDAEALATLKGFDYEMVRDSRAPLVFLAWFRQATIGIFADDLGPAFDAWFKARGNVMEAVLDGQTQRDWCDDRTTTGGESCADVLAAALTNALADLEERYGEDRSQWNWGRAHLSMGSHTPFSQIPVLKSIFDVQVPSPGGPFTLNRGQTQLKSAETPFINSNASSYRGIYDFSDLDKSIYIQTTGQSGNPFSKHYRDLALPWSNVEGITIPADPALYGPDIVGTWQLKP